MSLKENWIKLNSYLDGVNKSLIVTFFNCFRTVTIVAISSAPVGEENNSSCSEVISVDESMQCNELDGDRANVKMSQSDSSSSSASVASLSPLPPPTKKNKVEM